MGETKMPFDGFGVELLRKWVESLLSALEANVDAEARVRLMEACGRACAVHHGDLERAEAAGEHTDDLDELLDSLNRNVSWRGAWRREADVIVSVCEQCGCPLVREGLVKLSPAFCACSTGFVKALFERALGRPVLVRLEQAIGRGDPVCRFSVRIE
jgi:predicted hydrocarbon binding protein